VEPDRKRNQDNGQCCCYAIVDAATALQSVQALGNAGASTHAVLWHMPVRVAVHHPHYFCMLLRILPFHEEVALVFLRWQEQAGATGAYASTHDSHLPALFDAACQSSTSHTSIHAFSPPWLLPRSDKMGRPKTRAVHHSALPACPALAPLYTPRSLQACKTASRL